MKAATWASAEGTFSAPAAGVLRRSSAAGVADGKAVICESFAPRPVPWTVLASVTFPDSSAGVAQSSLFAQNTISQWANPDMQGYIRIQYGAGMQKTMEVDLAERSFCIPPATHVRAQMFRFNESVGAASLPINVGLSVVPGSFPGSDEPPTNTSYLGELDGTTPTVTLNIPRGARYMMLYPIGESRSYYPIPRDFQVVGSNGLYMDLNVPSMFPSPLFWPIDASDESGEMTLNITGADTMDMAARFFLGT